jgi:hypothetical protein
MLAPGSFRRLIVHFPSTILANIAQIADEVCRPPVGFVLPCSLAGGSQNPMRRKPESS